MYKRINLKQLFKGIRKPNKDQTLLCPYCFKSLKYNGQQLISVVKIKNK